MPTGFNDYLVQLEVVAADGNDFNVEDTIYADTGQEVEKAILELQTYFRGLPGDDARIRVYKLLKEETFIGKSRLMLGHKAAYLRQPEH